MMKKLNSLHFEILQAVNDSIEPIRLKDIHSHTTRGSLPTVSRYVKELLKLKFIKPRIITTGRMGVGYIITKIGESRLKDKWIVCPCCKGSGEIPECQKKKINSQ